LSDAKPKTNVPIKANHPQDRRLLSEKPSTVADTRHDEDIDLEQIGFSTDGFLSDPKYGPAYASESIHTHTKRVMAELEDFNRRFYLGPQKPLCRM
jgi:hypothetical protein